MNIYINCFIKGNTFYRNRYLLPFTKILLQTDSVISLSMVYFKRKETVDYMNKNFVQENSLSHFL